jgi:hypothetical protein
VQDVLKENPRKRAAHSRARTPALLKGLIFGPTGVAMTPTHTRRRGRLYRYYISMNVLKMGPNACPLRRIPAAEIEAIVIDQMKRMIQTPEIIVATWRVAKQSIKGLTERQVREDLNRFDEVWAQLFPIEQARITQLLVARVDVTTTEAAITLRTDGLATLVQDLQAAPAAETVAA